MPLTVPAVDPRRYADLLAEAVARIPVHTPEWTNFNRSDPGITLLELFAFLTETTIYRANLIPERNRLAFLSLLGIPLVPARPAVGLATVANERGPLATVTLAGDLELRAGAVPFRTESGLDVLPVLGRAYAKVPVALSDDLRYRYRRLYASYLLDGLPARPPPDLVPYATTALDGTAPSGIVPAGVDLVGGTVDGCLWIALFSRDREDPADTRAAIAGRVLSLGIVPVVDAVTVTLEPAGSGGDAAAAGAHLEFALPTPGVLPDDPAGRVAAFTPLPTRVDGDVLRSPGVVQLDLPARPDALPTWDLEPLEEGVGGFPPAVDDPALAARLVTWVRVQARGAGPARILWAGVNATRVTQRTRVRGELLPDGTGTPDQTVTLANTPVLPGTVALTVTPRVTPPAVGVPEAWTEVTTLADAGPEVPIPDPRLPPGAAPPPQAPASVYALDAEAGVLRFGDGTRGRRPPPGATLRADYDFALGGAGNVGSGAIAGGPALPPGFTAANPVRTWGGADAESVADGERQVALALQHRERLVSSEDFAAIAARAPGADLARVDVLPAYDPRLTPNVPGDAPGAVTLMIVPRRDPAVPDTPGPDRFTLDAVAAHLEPRRLVTTQLFLRGPDYVPIWISVGIDVAAGLSVAEVRSSVTAQLRGVLSPLPLADQATPAAVAATYPHVDTGWPLRTAVAVAELAAHATRVDGVRLVTGVLLGAGADAAGTPVVELAGLQLPRIAGIAVTAGDPAPLNALRGATPAAGPGAAVPVPALAEWC